MFYTDAALDGKLVDSKVFQSLFLFCLRLISYKFRFFFLISYLTWFQIVFVNFLIDMKFWFFQL